MKARRFGVDVQANSEEILRRVNEELRLLYEADLSDDAFRRAVSRLNAMMGIVGQRQEHRSVVQGGLNQVAHARVVRDLNRKGRADPTRPR